MLKKRLLLIVALIVTMAVAFAGCSSEKEEAEKIDLSAYENSNIFITPQELSEVMDSTDVIIFDDNKPDAYAKGHIPGSINTGFHSFSKTEGKPGDPLWGTTLDSGELQKKLEAYGVTNDKTVVFYSDVLSGPGPDGRNVWQMRMAGLDNVKLLYGGLDYWKELGYETTKEETPAPEPSTGLVLSDFDESYAADKDYIYENLGKTTIIDVRTEKEYKGSQNAGEARGGHIEGAKSLVWTELLNDDATPKSPEEIKSIMAEVGVKPEDDFVVY